MERRFLRSDSGTADLLITAFDPDVVIHEPASLPYPGDWCGLEGVTALFRAVRETWSDIRVEDLRSARDGDTVFMACTLHLTTAPRYGPLDHAAFAEVLRFKGDRLIDGTPFYYDTAAVTALLR